MILKYVMRDVFSSPKGWSGIINDINKMFCLKQQDVHNPRYLFLPLTCLSLYQSVCDVSPSCFTRSDDLHNLVNQRRETFWSELSFF